MERDRAFRRKCEQKAKRKAQNSMMAKWPMDGRMDERRIGRLASTHCKPCSCEMCGNPRKFFHEKTMREQRAELDDYDEEEEDLY